MARDGLRSHLSGSVPISIAAHLVVLILLLIAPLAADIALPLPEKDLPEFIRVAPPPPPPPPAPVAPARVSAGVPGGVGVDTGGVTFTSPRPPADPPRPATVRVAQLPEPPRKIV